MVPVSYTAAVSLSTKVGLSPIPTRSKVKSVGSRLGTVTLSTMMVPFLVLVKVHLTVSPAATLKVATPVPMSPELPASQVMSVRAQPVGTVSCEV